MDPQLIFTLVGFVLTLMVLLLHLWRQFSLPPGRIPLCWRVRRLRGRAGDRSGHPAATDLPTTDGGPYRRESSGGYPAHLRHAPPDQAFATTGSPGQHPHGLPGGSSGLLSPSAEPFSAPCWARSAAQPNRSTSPILPIRWAGWSEGLVILVGAVGTLMYFQFGANTRPDQPPRRAPVVEGLALVGQVFIEITLGALFAGVYAAAITALVERWLEIITTIAKFF